MGDTLRWIRSGAGDELTPLRRNETWVRIDHVLPEDAWPRVAELLSSRPDVQLSIERGGDLEMLRRFPGPRRLAARSLRLGSLDGLRHVAGSIEDLVLGDTLKRQRCRRSPGVPTCVGSRWARCAGSPTCSLSPTRRTEVLMLIGMNQLDAKRLRPFLGHPALRAGIWGLGSKRRNEAPQALLPLSPAPGASMAPWNDPGWDGIRNPTQT